ncbi:MAG: general secretion pathway protein GspB [Deltaproteobacteria bacterium]|nr:general secretion pathway protein GspB [Deltaproteobacteria bacterium]
MSYILDALKKSDRERHQGEVPGIDSIHDSYPRPPEQQPTSQWKKNLFIASGAILLISISSSAWYLSKKVSGYAEKISIDQKQQNPAVTENKAAEILIQTKEVEKKQKYSDSPVSLKRTKKKIVLGYSKIPLPEQKSIVIQHPAKAVDIPDLADLTVSMRETIPELHLAGHTYANDPAKRMIIINNKILREGEKAGNGLTLVEITWSGVIMNYRGQLFKIDMD